MCFRSYGFRVVPTSRISDGGVFEHLSTSNGVSLWKFCNFADFLQDVARRKTSVLAPRAFCAFRYGNLLISFYVCFCVFAAGIHVVFSFFTFLCPDSCLFCLFSLCAFHHFEVSTSCVFLQSDTQNVNIRVTLASTFVAYGYANC